MPRGPLPTGDAQRRNRPTIPTTKLPAGGFDGPAPEPMYDLGDAGQKWWDWAWSQPQAAAWDTGAHFSLSRRAQLEDDLDALGFEDDLDLADLLAGADPEAIKRVEWALGTLKKSATGSLAIEKEMRELDRRFGLDPKALAELRWTIVEPDEDADEQTTRPTAPKVRHLRPVDRAAS